MYGVTTEDAIDKGKRAKAIAALRNLNINNQKPFIRIVFQENKSAASYRDAVNDFRQVAFVVGEILDSAYVKKISVENYALRTQEFWNEFGNLVDIWEIGNEINGEWLRTTSAEKLQILPEPMRWKVLESETREVVEKMNKAFEIIHNGSGRTALTLYYNDDGAKNCYAFEQDSMMRWSEEQIPQFMKDSLDYVWISYYDDPIKFDGCRSSMNENDREGIPLNPDWEKDFKQLTEIFKSEHLQLGFGEIGTRIKKNKIDYIKNYYGGAVSEKIRNPKFNGGYFWWYFDTDRKNKKFLTALGESIVSHP